MKAHSLIRSAAFALLLSTLNHQPSTFAQGSLAPPGPPAPTMKSLAQIEPRNDVLKLAGDAVNLFVITNSGSYYLTGNIMGVSNRNGISIQAENVTLDLGGFEVIGVSGSGHGIAVPGSPENLCLRNGTVRNWGGRGIDASLASGSQFERLRLSDNVGAGLATGNACTVSDCTAQANGPFGISTGKASSVKHCTAQLNSGPGFLVSDGCVLTACAANANRGDGIVIGRNCIVKDSVAMAQPGAAGIRADFAGSTVIGCTASGNLTGITIAGPGSLIGCTAFGNYDAGINAGSGSTITDCSSGSNTTNGINAGIGCTIAGCSVKSNGGYGINALDSTTIRHTTCRQNTGGGIQTTYSCFVADNICDLNGGIGIHAINFHNRIENNLVTGNSGNGIQVDAGNNWIIKNSARNNSGASGNYGGIVGGNDVGPIGTAATATSPWANLNL